MRLDLKILPTASKIVRAGPSEAHTILETVGRILRSNLTVYFYCLFSYFISEHKELLKAVASGLNRLHVVWYWDGPNKIRG